MNKNIEIDIFGKILNGKLERKDIFEKGSF